jgi:hypothetical protein
VKRVETRDTGDAGDEQRQVMRVEGWRGIGHRRILVGRMRNAECGMRNREG